jgi:carbon storage regulator
MLILSRACDERIVINDDIIITVLEIKGREVRLGITAPIEVTVHRKEVHDAIQRDKERKARRQSRP